MTQNTAIGIDISKSKLDMCIKTQDKYIHKSFKNFNSDYKDINNFLVRNNITKEHQIIVESTGNYHIPVCINLQKRFDVKVINPIISKQKIKYDIRKKKTDKSDAILLAELGSEREFNTSALSVKEIEKLKIVKTIESVNKHITAIKLSIKNTKELFNQIGISTQYFTELLKALKVCELRVEELYEKLYELCDKKELVESVSKVKGITSKTALRLVSLLEDRKFKTKGAMVAYIGIDLSINESGQFRGKKRLTKRGKSILRCDLVRTAWGLYMHNNDIKEFYEKLKAQGRKYYEILVIIARKFVHKLFGAIKHGIFNPNCISEINFSLTSA